MSQGERRSLSEVAAAVPGAAPTNPIAAIQASTNHAGRHDDDDGCALCGQDHPFVLPKELLTAAIEGKLVVFAGAGISTESRRTMGDTFASRVRIELDDPESTLTFPELMSAYQTRFGRPQLLQRIRERLDYIKGFPTLKAWSTRFHRKLGTAYFLHEVVTTNWDTSFEDHAGATPIVVPDDYAFWDMEGRKVFKLHGSMHNVGTIVATEDDYERCYRRLRDGPVGATLKHLLATKRIVFIGYSFGDSDLNRILRFMRRELGDVLPRSYVVSPHGYAGDDFPPERVLSTDGTYFIQKLKEAAVDLGFMRPDSVYGRLDRLAMQVVDARGRSARAFKPDKYPAAIFNWAYQDGLLHALGKMLALESTGRYSNTHSHLVSTYNRALRGAIRTGEYFDAAYVSGYLNGLVALEADEEYAIEDIVPLYFVWGSKFDLRNFSDFKRELMDARTLHKAASAQADRIMAVTAPGLVPVHNHFLDVEDLVAAAEPRRRRRSSGARER